MAHARRVPSGLGPQAALLACLSIELRQCLDDHSRRAAFACELRRRAGQEAHAATVVQTRLRGKMARACTTAESKGSLRLGAKATPKEMSFARRRSRHNPFEGILSAKARVAQKVAGGVVRSLSSYARANPTPAPILIPTSPLTLTLALALALTLALTLTLTLTPALSLTPALTLSLTLTRCTRE